jgi:hypothetical protein
MFRQAFIVLTFFASFVPFAAIKINPAALLREPPEIASGIFPMKKERLKTSEKLPVPLILINR